MLASKWNAGRLGRVVLTVGAFTLLFAILFWAAPSAAQTALPDVYQYSIEGFQYRPGNMAGVRDLAVGPEGDVYVVDGVNRRIQRFNRDGEVVAVWGRAGSGDGEFEDPRGITVSSDGTVLVAESDYYNGKILRFDAMGRYLDSIGDFGVLDVAAAPDGGLCATAEDRVYCFNAEGKRAAWWSTAEGEDYLTQHEPIVIDRDGLVYVLDDENNKVKVYRQDGGLVRSWGIPRTPDDKYRDASSLVLHPDGTVHVGDVDHAEVLRFSREGILLDTWPAQAFALAFASDGTAFALDDEEHVVRRYSAESQMERSWGGLDPERAAFRSPEAMAFAPDGSLYVADSNWGVIHHLDRLGLYLGRIGRENMDEPGELAAPYDVAVTSEANLLVPDYRLGQIRSFSPKGALLETWDVAGAPMGIGVAADDTAFVTLSRRHEVLHLGRSGEELMRWGSEGPARGQLDRPSGLTVASDGSVLVADRGNDRVQRFAPSGLFLDEWGGSGTELGQFDGLADLTMRRDGTVLTVEMINDRIQWFDIEGNSLGAWETNAHTMARHHNSVASDVAEGPDGNVYVADRVTGEIEVFDTAFSADWHAEFFDNPWLAGRSTSELFVPTLDLDWGDAAPIPGLPADGFSARFFRHVHFETGGQRFRLHASGGARLWVDKRLLIDSFASAAVETEAEIWLDAGGHNLRLEFKDPGGPAALTLEWESASLLPPTPSPTPRATPTRSGPPPPTCCGRSYLPALMIDAR